MMSIGNVNQAICYWKKALSLEISRLEEKEQILNALLGKGTNVNVVVNTQNNKEVLWKRIY